MSPLYGPGSASPSLRDVPGNLEERIIARGESPRQLLPEKRGSASAPALGRFRHCMAVFSAPGMSGSMERNLLKMATRLPARSVKAVVTTCLSRFRKVRSAPTSPRRLRLQDTTMTCRRMSQRLWRFLARHCHGCARNTSIIDLKGLLPTGVPRGKLKLELEKIVETALTLWNEVVLFWIRS